MACRFASSSTVWTASPMPNRSIGWSPPFSITKRLRPRNWRPCTVSAGRSKLSLDELKTHLRGSKIVLRSKTPALVKQEFYGLMMAHYAIRGLMHEAALKADEDPDRLSFIHAVRVIRRKLDRAAAIPPSQAARLS